MYSIYTCTYGGITQRYCTDTMGDCCRKRRLLPWTIPCGTQIIAGLGTGGRNHGECNLSKWLAPFYEWVNPRLHSPLPTYGGCIHHGYRPWDDQFVDPFACKANGYTFWFRHEVSAQDIEKLSKGRPVGTWKCGERAITCARQSSWTHGVERSAISGF